MLLLIRRSIWPTRNVIRKVLLGVLGVGTTAMTMYLMQGYYSLSEQHLESIRWYSYNQHAVDNNGQREAEGGDEDLLLSSFHGYLEGPHHRRICPFAPDLFSGTAEIIAAIQNADDFHVQGGNLKAIQAYLDAQLDATYTKLGVSYERPSGELVSKTGMTQAIHEELKRNDPNQRGGYDQRQLPGKLAPIPASFSIGKRHVDVMEAWDFEKWKAALGPIGPNCTSVDRIQQRAQPHYEDKFMCSYDQLAASNTDNSTSSSSSTSSPSSSSSSCHILSIGSNDQWGFESTVLQHAPHCHTHTFDCTLQTPRRKPNTTQASFHSICIAGEHRDDPTTGRQYRTYAELVNLTGMMMMTTTTTTASTAAAAAAGTTGKQLHQQRPKLLKMDVEGFEYDVLSSMMPARKNSKHDDDDDDDGRGVVDNDDDFLPEQIIVELHYASRMYDLPWMLRSRQAAEISMLLSQLYTRGGYLPVFVNYDPGCAPCLEVLFVKILCR